jgi:hypothetical protein
MRIVKQTGDRDKPILVGHLGGYWMHDKDEYWIRTGRPDVPTRLSLRALILACGLFNKHGFTDPDDFRLFLQYLLECLLFIILRESERFSRWANRNSPYIWYSPPELQLRI